MRTRAIGGAAAVLLVLDLVVAGYLVGLRSGQDDATAAAEQDDLGAIEEVYERIVDEAVDSPDPDVLVEGAIEGMLDTLDDDYAAFYDSEQYAALNEQLDGRFVGIGVVLDPSDTGLVVQSVLPQSPAEEAGLKPQDAVVAVDGEEVADLPTEEIVDRVRGPEGTSVALGIRRDGERLEFEVERRELTLPNVEARLLEGTDLGYVRLQSFSRDAGTEVRDAVQGLVDEEDLDGLVLDLRDNPGGILGEAVEVASLFVDEGLIVSVGDDPGTGRRYEAEGETVYDGPLVVLVNEGSASASEIVAAALKDAGRATLVGTTTFGKGVVQTITGLDEGGGVKFTTARYYTPSGTSIDGVGVVADREVADGEDPDVDPPLELAEELLRTRAAAAPTPTGAAPG